MREEDIGGAADLLVAARLQGRKLAELPLNFSPATFQDAAAIQIATAERLQDPIVAYKVSSVEADSAIWGGILASRLLANPAVLPAAEVPLLGVEGEIAYRVEAEIGPADRSFTLEAFDTITTVVPTIEIVDTRFLSYTDAPAMHRTADFMSNGALVYGQPWPEGKKTDLTKLEITVSRNGELMSQTIGGHSATDPRLPALAFLNSKNRPGVIHKNTIITTGTYTGLKFVEPGDRITILFAGYGSLEITFSV
jgi:2-keto-4-pentenoate hydratase